RYRLFRRGHPWQCRRSRGLDTGKSLPQPGDRHRPLSHAAHHEGIFRGAARCFPARLSGGSEPHRPGRLLAASAYDRIAAPGICQIFRRPGDHGAGSIMTVLRSALFLLWFLISTPILSLVFLPVLAGPRKATVWLARLWARWTFWGLKIFAGIGWEIRGH